MPALVENHTHHPECGRANDVQESGVESFPDFRPAKRAERTPAVDYFGSVENDRGVRMRAEDFALEPLKVIREPDIVALLSKPDPKKAQIPPPRLIEQSKTVIARFINVEAVAIWRHCQKTPDQDSATNVLSGWPRTRHR
jgi:hypothetical protein